MTPHDSVQTLVTCKDALNTAGTRARTVPSASAIHLILDDLPNNLDAVACESEQVASIDIIYPQHSIFGTTRLLFCSIPLRRQDEIVAVWHIFAIERMRELPCIACGLRAILPKKSYFNQSWNCEAPRV